MTVTEDPRRYFEAVDTQTRQATAPPVCLYLEVTNRCNLLMRGNVFTSIGSPTPCSTTRATSGT